MLSEDCFANEMNKKVFLFFKNIMETSQNFDISMLNRDFSSDEVGKITKMTLSEAAAKILIRADKFKNYVEGFIKKTETAKPKDDWANYIRSKAN